MKEVDDAVLPESDVHWSDIWPYVERIPDIEYEHASEKARENFKDMKFGVRIH